MTATKISLCHVNEPLSHTHTQTHARTHKHSGPYQWEGERSPFTSCINYEWQAKGHRGRRGHSYGQNIDLYFYLFSSFYLPPSFQIYHSVLPLFCSFTCLFLPPPPISFGLPLSLSRLLSLLTLLLFVSLGLRSFAFFLSVSVHTIMCLLLFLVFLSFYHHVLFESLFISFGHFLVPICFSYVRETNPKLNYTKQSLRHTNTHIQVCGGVQTDAGHCWQISHCSFGWTLPAYWAASSYLDWMAAANSSMCVYVYVQ